MAGHRPASKEDDNCRDDVTLGLALARGEEDTEDTGTKPDYSHRGMLEVLM